MIRDQILPSTQNEKSPFGDFLVLKGLESYRFSTPFGQILPVVESAAKGLRVPVDSLPDCRLSLAT